MTPEQIAEGERLLALVSYGPWIAQAEKSLAESTLSTVAWCGDWQIGWESGRKGGNYRDGLHGADSDDAAAICWQRNNAAAIFAHIRDLEARLAAVEALLRTIDERGMSAPVEEALRDYLAAENNRPERGA